MAEYFLDFEKPIEELTRKISELQNAQVVDENIKKQLDYLQQQYESLKKELYSKLTTSQRVLIARHPQRPYSLDYINGIFRNFVEIHGDRNYRDDKAVICGFAEFDLSGDISVAVAIIGQQKGRSLEENLYHNFGMMHPEGYRKALRTFKLAEKFKMPLITFIDTPGAYPGIGAEERGQAEAIAKNLKEMSILKIPIISVVIGEGGSGGALGIGVADKLLMLENAYYSVITPEGCASILYRDASKWQEAAEVLRIKASDLHSFGIVDEVISEPLGGAHKDVKMTIENLKKSLQKNLEALIDIPIEKLINLRYQKYRQFGKFKILDIKK